MAEQQIDNCSYPSKFSPNKFVTAAQYITEIICEKKALADSGGNLPTKFWEIDKWATYFRQQIPTAHKLLKRFSAKAIIRALSHWKANKIYSLRAPHLIPLCQSAELELKAELVKIQERQDKVRKMVPEEVPIEDYHKKLESMRPGKQSQISKLKDLDNG